MSHSRPTPASLHYHCMSFVICRLRARGEFLLMADADGAAPISEWVKLRALANQNQVVIGRRKSTQRKFSRLILSLGFRMLIRIVSATASTSFLQTARPQFNSIFSSRLRFAAPHVLLRCAVFRSPTRSAASSFSLAPVLLFSSAIRISNGANELPRALPVFNFICALLPVERWARCLPLNVTLAQVCIRCRGLVLSRQGEFQVRRSRN